MRFTTEGKPSWVFPFFMVLLLWSSLAQAQVHEFGASLGATNYVGDLVRTYQLRNHRPAGALFYRYNLSNHTSLRANLMLGKLVGADDPAYDVFAARRNRGQFNNWVNELSVLFEYNFFNYKNPDKDLVRWSPYFVGGIGIMLQHGFDRYDAASSPRGNYDAGRKTTDFKNFQPVVPVGLGIKYRITPIWTFGAEWVARKTFFDNLDNTGAIPEGVSSKSFEFGNDRHNDWYFFTGFTLSYTIWTIPCPYLFDNRNYL